MMLWNQVNRKKLKFNIVWKYFKQNKLYIVKQKNKEQCSRKYEDFKGLQSELNCDFVEEIIPHVPADFKNKNDTEKLDEFCKNLGYFLSKISSNKNLENSETF